MEEKKTFEILTEDLNSSQIPLRLVSTPHAGRCLVATRDIAKGEELFKEKRLVHGPPQGRTLCCVNCSRLIDLSKSLTNTDCRECGLPLCSESCPDTFGRVHEEDCEFFRKVDLKKSHIRLAPKWLTAFRVLQIIKKSPKIWKKLQLLEDHLEERRNTELMEINRTEVFDVLNELFPDENYDEETVMRICGILDGNAFRCDAHGDRAVFGLASMINHDCRPNARVIFDADKDLHLVAKVDIPKFTEVTITYCNPMLGTPERQEVLLKNKLFRCRCKRCQDPSEFNSFIYALLCPKCQDCVLPRWSDTKQEFDYKCRKCPFTTTQAKVEKLTEAIYAAQKRLLEAKNVRVLRLEELLEKHLKVLPPTHSLLLKFKSEISGHLATKRSLETIDKRMRWLQERIDVLAKVDGDSSRLMGFLNWKMHNFYIEKIAFCQRNGNLTDLDLGEMTKGLERTLEKSAEMLILDGGCPPELKHVLKIQAKENADMK